MSTVSEHRLVPRWRWVAEAVLLVGIYTAYSVMRNKVGSARVPYGDAASHAKDILALERAFFLDIEAGAQRVALAFEPLTRLAGIYYRGLHQWAVITMLGYLLARRSDLYPRLRTTLVVVTLLALAGFILYPLAPPRLLPELGFVDTVRLPTDAWQPQPAIVHRNFYRMATNQFAAMPSLHVAFATWVVVAAWLACGRRGRAAAIVHLSLTWVAVVVTANHWVLDGVAGAALVGVGWVVASQVHTRFLRARPGRRVYADVGNQPDEAAETSSQDKQPRRGDLHARG